MADMSKDYEELERSVEGYAEAPLPVVLNGGVWPAPKHRFSLVACARWETRYILEWIAYHRSIGFDHLYLYCNDDDPAALYETVLPLTVGDEPFVTFIYYSYVGLQFQMYFHFLRNYLPETEWMIFLDIDEFLVLKGVDDIGTFAREFPDDIDALYFNWCSFGHNDHQTRTEGSVLANYTRREDGATPFTKILVKSKAVPYKTIYWRQPAPINHDLKQLDKNMHAVNVLGDSMSDYYKTFPESGWDYLNQEDRRQRIVRKAFIAHYNMKSHEDFEIRVRRSLEGAFEGQKMWGDFSEDAKKAFHKSTNAVEDFYLRDYWLNLKGGGWARSVFPPSAWPCLSRRKPATEISTAHNCSVREDAGRVLSGQFWGRSQSHTQIETDPWWRIDFESLVRIHEVRLFNRLDGCLDRVANFQIESSLDGENWIWQIVKNDGLSYGGADGTPYIWRNEEGFTARYVRIIILGKEQFLNFDQVEFYGTPLPVQT